MLERLIVKDMVVLLSMVNRFKHTELPLNITKEKYRTDYTFATNAITFSA